MSNTLGQRVFDPDGQAHGQNTGCHPSPIVVWLVHVVGFQWIACTVT
ncbi:hypothetical protein [Streptomyces sp. A1136]|nr:hypothetical protein [Streptomyces sp. A1136]